MPNPLVTRRVFTLFFFLFCVTVPGVSVAPAQTGSITYQGKFTEAGQPANGSFDLQFKLFDALSAGAQEGVTVTLEDVVVTNGVFTVQLNFGLCPTCFNGAARFLEISVRPGANTGTFTLLTPRQPVQSTPYAIRSLSAGSADNATQLGGVAAANYLQGITHDATLTGNGTTGAPLSVVSSGWSLTGNAGTNPATNFLGTTDNQPMVFRVNGAELMRLSATGRIGIGLTAPGEKLHLGDGNFLLEGGGETAVKIKRDFTISGGPSGTSRNPIFELGRIIQAGDGDPEFRFLYSDDNTPPRAVFEFDRKGIVASVKPARGSHFGGFISNTDPEPIFRLNSFPKMRLEMGDGGATPVDVAVQREAASTLTFLTGNAERVRIDANGNLGVGTTTPTSRLHVVGDANVTTGLTVGGTITGNGSGLTNLNAGNIATGTLLTARGGTGLSAAGAVGNYLRSDGTNWTSSALQPADLPGGNGNYIQNSTSVQTPGNFNLSATGKANIFNAVAEYQLNGARFLRNTGVNNLFVGIGTGVNTTGTDNTFVGSQAGDSTTSGINNTFVGSQAGDGNTQGNDNTFIGASAGVVNTLGSNNTMLGSGATLSGSNLSFATAIGAGAVVMSNSSVVLGRAADTVRVPGALNVTGATTLSSGTVSGNLTINGNTIITLGTPSASQNICINASREIVDCTISSARHKQNITPLRAGLAEINRLRPVNFTWKTTGEADFGLIAEEVAEITPILSAYDKDGALKGVRYDKLPIVLVNAVKEQQALIQQQQQQLRRQEAELELLRQAVCELQPRAAACQPPAARK